MFKNLIFSVLLSGFFAGTLCAEPAGNAVPPPEKGPHCRHVADDGDEMPPPPAPKKMSDTDVKMLKTLFLMSNHDLRKLREFIQRLEKLSPEHRRQMAADIEKAVAAKTPEQRKAFEKHMRDRYRKYRGNLLDKYYATLSPEDAEAERKKFLSLSREERREYIATVRAKLGYKPMQRHRGKGDKVPPPPPKED